MTDSRAWLEELWAQAHPANKYSPDEYVLILCDALIAVLDLHCQDWEGACDECSDPWPCATVRAIDKTLGVSDD